MQKLKHALLGVFYCFACMFATSAYAESKVALAELQALQHSNLQQYQSISAAALAQANCADLAVYASNNQRDLQNLMTYAQNLSQAPSQVPEKGGLLRSLVSAGANFIPIPGANLVAEAAGNNFLDGAKSIFSFNRERKQNQQVNDQTEAVLARYRLQQQEGQFIQMERTQKGCIA
ncbi:hypothetical protein [uncultured Acinetobacter sp.]|uniref:hypothetical protein n=1 Tax=uncultured Acinetobacter sp. TaxID=165433 RepID=UPI00260605B4|nr:hypothetical protein [uncultured Acinetobacter sp.]